MAIGKELVELMNSINYEFVDLKNLECALTHTSYTNEMKAHGYRAESNEVLEFLGDAVLELVISEILFDKYRKLGEGTLTKIRQSLVCERTLAKIATKLNIGEYLNIGRAEEESDLRNRTKVLADALEAIIAAIYIDDRACGGNRYKSCILGIFEPYITDTKPARVYDYKTMLQQFVEKNGDSELRYEVVDEIGPEHSKTFRISAVINNNVVGVGEGRTKKTAEMMAAKQALLLFGVLGRSEDE